MLYVQRKKSLGVDQFQMLILEISKTVWMYAIWRILIFRAANTLGGMEEQMKNVSLKGWIGLCVMDKMQDIFPVLEAEHLVRNGSDRAPLLLTIDTIKEKFVRPFKFLNFWEKSNPLKKWLKEIGEQTLWGILSSYFITK